jgi:hypothetical protein
MGYQLQIEIPFAKTDSNQILGVNKFAKNAIFKKVKTDVALLVRGKEPVEPLKNFKLHVIRESSKTLDFDNFIASLKPYIDGLRLSGIIFDDSWEYIKQINVNQVISKDKKLIIRVVENV